MIARASNERDLGRILEALETGKEDRARLERALEEANRRVTQLCETVAAFTAEFALMNDSVRQAAKLAARVTALEARVSPMSNDLQAVQSFISLAKSWSIKAVIGVLMAMALGVAASSKVLDIVLKIFGK